MKKIISLIFISVLLTGCEKEDQHYYLDENYRSILNEGDTLIYTSNLNNEAVYTVILKIEGIYNIDRKPYPWSYIVEGPQMAKKFYQVEYTIIDSVGKVLTQTQEDFLRSLTIHRGGPTFYYISSLPGFIAISNYANGSTFPGTGKLSVTWYYLQQKSFKTSSSLKIPNREFKNIIYCDLDPLPDSTGRYVSTVYFNSRECLLGFEYSDGEIFELVNF